MQPIERKDRSSYPGGPRVSVADVNDKSKVKDLDKLVFLNNEDNYNEDGDMSFLVKDTVFDGESVMSAEQTKIKAINLAINMAKLLSNVNVDDVLKIAAKVAVYIKK